MDLLKLDPHNRRKCRSSPCNGPASRQGKRMRERSRTGHWAPGLLSRPGILAVATLIAVLVGVALTSSTAQGAARLAVRLAAAAKSLPRRAPSAPAILANGRVFNGTPAVGALFTGSVGHLSGHSCTASVVDSPAGDLVITAAHCVTGSTRYAFAPGYHNGWAPYGMWTVSRVFVDRAWSGSADPNDDVAFLVVKQAGRGQSIQQVTGADKLGTGWGPVQVVQVRVMPVDFGDLATSRNYAVNQVAGGFVALVDGDDLVSRNWFSSAYECARRYRSEEHTSELQSL